MYHFKTFLTQKNGFAILLGIFIIARFLFPQADPSPLKLTPDISDEGWWATPALNKLHTGSWVLHGESGGFVLSPLYNLLLYCWLKLLGSGGLQLRILHIITGCISIVSFYIMMKKIWHKKAEIATMLFASNFFLFSFSRLGFPENLQITLIIWHLALLPKVFSVSNRLIVLPVVAGLLMGLAFWIKVSFIGIIPAVSAVWLMMMMRNGFQLQKAILILLGTIIPIVIWIWTIYLPFQLSFSTQKEWMFEVFSNSNNTSTIIKLWYWLTHIIQSPFLLHPSNFLLVLLAALSLIGTGNLFWFSTWREIPEGKAIALSFFWACFALMLFSDGSERRLVFLLPLLVVIASDTEIKIDKTKPFLLILKYLIFIFLTANCYYWLLKYFSPLFSIFILTTLISLAAICIKLAFSYLNNYLLWSAFIIWVGCFAHSAMNWLGYSWFTAIAIYLFLSIVAFCIIKKVFSFRILFIFYVLLNIILTFNYLSHPYFSNRTIALKSSKILGRSKVSGPNIAFSFRLYGNHTPLYHSDITPNFKKFYLPHLLEANYYIDTYQARERNYDPLPLLSEIFSANRTANEVLRDTLFPQFRERAEVIVIYELGKLP